jgi:hypothetical protein
MSNEIGEYEFTVDWFTQNEHVWRLIFQKLLPDAKKILEIGSFEGRSAVWLMQNGFNRDLGGDLYCIDTWQGGVDYEQAQIPKIQISEVERRFDHNIEQAKLRAPHVKLHKIRQASRASLVQLLASGHAESFDFVYVDGSHMANEVLSDLVLSFALCKLGGVIVCDDYLKDQGQNPLFVPKLAIDSFVNCFVGKVAVLGQLPLYQLYLRKFSS